MHYDSNVIPANPRESGGEPESRDFKKCLDARFRGHDGKEAKGLFNNFNSRTKGGRKCFWAAGGGK
jgi:hypothetical protein